MEDNDVRKEEVAETERTAEGGTSSADIDIRALHEALDKKESEYRDLNDKYLRTLAEMDNFRKRMLREQTESAKYANEKILCDLLTVVDNIERAILHSREKKDFDALTDGLDLTMKEFTTVMEKYGVKCIESIGQAFDPARHHAVSMVESDAHQDNTIMEEFRKGYILNDRILRPSLVSVVKKKEGTE